MASSGTCDTSSYQTRYLRFSWEETSQSESNLYTKISWTLSARGGNVNWYNTGPIKVKIDGTTVYNYTGRKSMYKGEVTSGTATIYHNKSTGKGSFKVEIEAAIYTYAVNCTGSKTFTLDTIDVKPDYTVKFDLAGGSRTGGGALTQTIEEGNDATPPTCSRTGYNFVKWDGTYTNITSNRTITATWEKITYTIKYALNGGSGTFGNQTKTYGEDLTLRTGKPTKSFELTYNANGGSLPSGQDASVSRGCTFANWKDGDGATYSAGGKYTKNKASTLTAQWTNPTLGTLPVPTRSGYKFLGWFTSASGGTQVTASTALSADTTIYAQWSALYSVTYDLNGGSNGPDSQTKQNGVDLTLSSVKPTKACRITYDANGGSVSPTYKDVAATFVEWNTESDGSGTSYQPGDTYTSNAALTLYAIWSYNKAGTLSTPTRTNATFSMWTTTKTGDTEFTSDNVVSSNITIYARWTYKIIFNGNGGTLYDPINHVAGDQIVDIKEFGVDYIIPEYSATYNEDSYTDVDEEGNEVVENESATRTFLGFATSATAKKAEYVAGDTYSTDAPLVLYAVYSVKTYTVTFYDGYSDKVLKQYTDVEHGSSVTPPPDPTRKGYTFAGWLGDYSYVISDRKIIAFWGCTPIWIMTKSGWHRYEPEE